MVRYLATIALALSLAWSACARSAAPGGLVLSTMVESSGAADLGSAPGNGELLRFIPRGRFAIGVLLENRSAARLVVTGADVVEPPGTLLHQVSTHFHLWNPPKCPPGAFCPAYGFPLPSRRGHPRPFAVAPGRAVGVELDFRLGSCAETVSARYTPISRLRVTFRTPGGQPMQRVLALRGAELHLRRPKPKDCP